MDAAVFQRVIQAEREILGEVVNWADKTFDTSVPTVVAHEANTHLDITGSGYLVALGRTTNATVYYSIQIDGGDIYRVHIDTNLTLSPIRFKTALKIACSAAASVSHYAWVVLD